MTRLTLFILTLALGIGGTLYEARHATRQRGELEALQKNSDRLTSEIANLRAGLDDARRESATLRVENHLSDAGGASGSDPAEPAFAAKVLAQLTELHQFFEENPAQAIPELALLSTLDWLDVARGSVERNSGKTQLRFAAEDLRFKAKEKFARQMFSALDRYKRANAGLLPTELAQLAPLFEAPPDPAILQRYDVLHSGKASELAPTEWIIAENSLADDQYERRLYFKPSGAWNSEPSANMLNSVVQKATWAFAKTNERKPTDPAQLVPYLGADEKKYYDLATLQRFWNSPLRQDPLVRASTQAVIHVRQSSNGVMSAEIEEPR